MLISPTEQEGLELKEPSEAWGRRVQEQRQRQAEDESSFPEKGQDLSLERAQTAFSLGSVKKKGFA